ncbi:MAG: CPBP family intramembrane metalloprotease [Candidatus Eisenbacteria bacterium]|nr:CPBP family intramembrane metalloprotease [Candidatus Eisenbacteria bacterium]
MPGALDTIFALTLAVFFPLRAMVFGYRRLTDAADEDVPRVRLWLYRQGIAIQWTLAIACVLLWAAQRRTWAMLGLVPRLSWGLGGVALGFAIVVLYILRERKKAIADDEALARLRERMRHIERMLPRSNEDLMWFARLSITAGICEELLYRGYLIWYVNSWLGVLPSAAVASVIFGFGHIYQGPRGVLITAVVGLFMSAIYLLTGSLFACMVIHAAMDLYSGMTARIAFAREPRPEAAGEVVSS